MEYNVNSDKYTSIETLVTAQDLTASYVDFGAVIPVQGYNKIVLHIKCDHNTSINVLLKAVSVDGSDNYDMYNGGVLQEVTLWATDTTDDNQVHTIGVGGLSNIKIQAMHGSASGTVGDLTIKRTLLWD